MYEQVQSPPVPSSAHGRPPVPAAVAGLLRTARRGHPGLFWFAAALGALAAVAAVGVVVDDRTVLGVPAWLKPFKFAASFGLYALTLAWMLAMVPRPRRLGTVLGWVLVMTSAIEVLIIAGQAARGRRSHFNDDTPLDALLSSVMGATVVLLWLATAAVAVVVVRRRVAGRVARWAIGLGLLVGLAGMALGVLMVLQPGGGAHSVGVADGGPGLPLVGWSTAGGDLRTAHFVGIHAMQVLPLLGAVLAAAPLRLRESARVRLVGVAAAGYAGLVALLAWQALRGQPLLAPDAATLAGLAVLLAGAAGGAALVVRRG